ncbi:SAV_2336 N-terminal domain-related protein [Streptomyces sp. NPDC021080]|uniref:SAV_2336 N-terminal domain-related protein n=1 Tax=Streptomyces sp. NPDC021080 TaxID=3365110 RepID=UPI00378761B4
MNPEFARVLLDCDAGIGMEEILDVAWLAARLPAVNSAWGEGRPDTGHGSAGPGGDGAGGHERRGSENPAAAGGPLSVPVAPHKDLGVWPRTAEPAITEMGGFSSRVVAPLPAQWLPRRSELGNALRPLRRTSPSPVRTVVDEELTAEWAAATGMVVPMVTAAEEPHYDLALVCDTTPSMKLWTPLVREMGRAAARFGAFRSVTVRRLDSDAALTTPTSAGGGRAGLRTLLAPDSRRVIAFVTDGVGRGWHDGRLAAQVHLLAAYGPVVIVHLLPRHLWGRTGVSPLPVSFPPQAEGTGTGWSVPPAQRFSPAGWSLRDLWPSGRPPGGGRPHAVPVVPLEPDSLNRWASFVTGPRARAVTAPAWVVTSGPDDGPDGAGPAPDITDECPVDEEELLDDFDATATPRARRLLRSLAAVPLNLSTMWLTHMVTSQWRREPYDPAPLAEVFFSGLLRPRPVPDGGHDGEPSYKFVGDTRQTLLEGMDRVEAVRTFQTVSAYVSTTMGRAALAFPALLASPRDVRLVGQIDPETRPFAEVAARILRGLGPAYGEAVRRIEAAVAEFTDGLGASGASGSPDPSGSPGPSGPPGSPGAAQAAAVPPAPPIPASAPPGPDPAPPPVIDRSLFPELALAMAAPALTEEDPVPAGRPPLVPAAAFTGAERDPAPSKDAPHRAARQRRRTIAVLGAANSGKTTFLAAASLAATTARPGLGRWNIVAESERAENFLVQQTNALAVVRRFPEATMGPTAFSYVFRAEVSEGRRAERIDFALDFCDVGGGEFRRENYGRNHVLDAHLGRAGHLVILLDPLSRGGQAELLVPHLQRLAQEFHEGGRLIGGRLPHHVAFCVTKFDDPAVFQDARRGNWVGQTSQGDPCVPAADAADYVAWLSRRSADVAGARNLVLEHFLARRVRWYAVSAIGFHRTRDGFLDLDDCSNQTYDENGLRALRGPARPLNVLEPLIALGRASGGI